MKHISRILLVGACAHFAPTLWAQAPCSSTVTGDLRIESFQSTVYGDRRTVRIWLPADYGASETTGRRYPVLYLFDGQTLFDNCTAFANERELQVDETTTRLIAEQMIPPMIVAGIDSSGRRSFWDRPA